MDIPNNLSKEYFISNTNLKFGNFDNKEFELKLQQNLNNEIFLEDLNNLISNLDSFINLYSEIILSNKIGINDYLKKLNKNSLEYLIISKGIKIILNEIYNKFQDSKNKIEKFPSIDDFLLEFQNEKFNSIFNIQFPENSNDKNELNNNISKIIKYCSIIKNSTSKIGLIHLNLMIYFINIHIKEIINQIKLIETFDNINNNNSESKFLDFLLNIKRIDSMPLSILNSFLLSSDDICNIPESSKEWENIKKFSFRIRNKNEEKIKELIKAQSEKNKFLLTVFYDSILKKNNLFLKFFSTIGNSINYKINKNLKEIQFKKAQFNFNPEMLLEIQKFKKNKTIKNILIKFYPKIQFRKKLYLKKEFKIINLEYIQILNDFLNEKIPSKNNQNSFFSLKNISQENLNKPLFYEKIEKNEKKNYVSTRLIFTSKIYFKNEILLFKEKPKFFSFNNNKKNITNINKEINNINTIFIHIHGGAFIGSSTFNQENYLREWCKKFNIPLFGIDYGLSPKNHYPSALNDCFQAYMWILTHSKEELNINPNKIIISGDSAGGNLCLSLVFLLIAINKYENVNIKLPDLILVEYPTTYEGEDNVTNSLILSIKDLVFDPFVLKFVRDAYVGDYKNYNDPFLNPIKANEKILDKLPKIRFFCGSNDPLRDDTYRMLYSISKVPNLDVKSYEFYLYWHSFNGIEPKELRKMPWDFFFAEIEEFFFKNK